MTQGRKCWDEEKNVKQMRKNKDSFSTLGGLNGYVSGIFISSWYLPPERKGLKDNII